MADRAESLYNAGKLRNSGPVAPIRGGQFVSGEAAMRSESSEQPSGPKLLEKSSTDRSAGAFRGVKARAVSLYSAVTDTSSKITTGIWRRMSQKKDEQPLQFLAAMAGTAFVIGVLLRVWRSRSYE